MLTPEIAQKLLEELLTKTGLPASFEGDRLDAFKVGAINLVNLISKRVSLDPEPELPKKPDNPDEGD